MGRYIDGRLMEGAGIRSMYYKAACSGKEKIEMRKTGLWSLGLVSALLLGSSITVMAESDGMEITEYYKCLCGRYKESSEADERGGRAGTKGSG